MRVIFFPKSELPVSICNHRYGADMTYTEQSDSFTQGNEPENTRDTVEYYAHKHGARLGVFSWSSDPERYGGIDEIKATEKYGIIKFDMYFRGQYWISPNSGQLEIIPDFTRTAWTQAGIDVFGYIEDGVTKINGVAVEVGSPKERNQPGHGVPMYEYSNGKYGWSSEGVLGDSHANEFFLSLQEQVEGWKDINGRYPSCGSYGSGSNTAKDVLISKFLGIRNSERTNPSSVANAYTWYGLDEHGNFLGYPDIPLERVPMCNRRSSTRWFDSIQSGNCTKAEMMAFLTLEAQVTSQNHGWLNNFTHWQDCNLAEDTDIHLKAYDDYWTALESGWGTVQVHFCNYGEAVEYMTYRNDIEKVSAYQKNGYVIVAVKVKDRFAGGTVPPLSTPTALPENRIKTPISIEVDLTGTSLAGRYIQSSFGNIIDRSNNKVIVEVPYPIDNNNMSAIKLSASDTPKYESLARPIISNVSVEGNLISFNTDIPCYSQVFKIIDADNVTRVGERYIDSLKTEHHVVKESSGVFAIGVISKLGKTSLYSL